MRETRSSAARRTSLGRRLVWAFGIFSFLLTALFGFVVWGAVHLSEDLIIARVLRLELDDYMTRRAGDPEAPLPIGRWLEATDEIDALPAVLRVLADADDGIHELSWDLDSQIAGDEPEFHLAIQTLDDDRRLYLYLDASKVEVLDTSYGLMSWTVAMGISSMTLLGIALGHATARRITRPLAELARRVEETDPESTVSLAEGLGDDEVALLARALDSSRARSRAFLERERRFTRDASHELRSPVTVIRGAVELLEALPEAEKPTVRRPLERIRRAVETIGRLIDAFLWLAREEALAEGSAPRLLAREVRAAISSHRHLLVGKEVTVETAIPETVAVEAPDGILGIVLGNLVANAFHFTQSGTVDLRWEAERLEIADTGPGVAPEQLETLERAHRRGRRSEGFGLGLAIVVDLCERFGWQFEIESAMGEGFVARVDFGLDATARTRETELKGKAQPSLAERTTKRPQAEDHGRADT